MDKLMDFVCDELKEIERKAGNGKLSMAEVEYADKLAHLKKNLLKADEMTGEGEFSYGYDGGSFRMFPVNNGMNSMNMGSYAGRRNARRDSMGRYSRNGYSRDSEMVSELREMMETAPDERTRQEFQRFITKIESM